MVGFVVLLRPHALPDANPHFYSATLGTGWHKMPKTRALSEVKSYLIIKMGYLEGKLLRRWSGLDASDSNRFAEMQKMWRKNTKNGQKKHYIASWWRIQHPSVDQKQEKNTAKPLCRLEQGKYFTNTNQNCWKNACRLRSERPWISEVNMKKRLQWAKTLKWTSKQWS